MQQVQTQLLELVRRPTYEFRLDPSDAAAQYDDERELIHNGRTRPDGDQRHAPPVAGLHGVQAGSLRKLVELLTNDPERPDAYGSEVLLRAQRAPPGTMLDLLLRRYLIPAVTVRAESTDEARCDAVRSATLWLLRQWIRVALAEMPYSVLLTLWVFVEDHVSEQDSLAANMLRNDLTEEQLYEFAAASDVVSVLRPQNPGPRPACLTLLPPNADAMGHHSASKLKAEPPVLPPDFREESALDPTSDGGGMEELFDLLDSKELARQVAAADHALFREISRAEFLSNSWRQSIAAPPAIDGGGGSRSPGDAEHVGGGGSQLGWLVGARAIRFQNWVSTCVVRAEEPAVALRKWIDVAEHCLLLQNLNGLVAVVRGLEHVSVEHAWNQLQSIAADRSDAGAAAALEANTYLDKFLQMHTKTSPDNNFRNISTLVRRSELPTSHLPPPCPTLALVMTVCLLYYSYGRPLLPA